MKVLVINGANLNMLGIREPEIYGSKTLKDLEGYIQEKATEIGVEATCVQSNYEGELVEYIQKALGKYDGIIINAGGYTHTSIVILDALKAVGLPCVEVHLSNIFEREEFRKHSYISLYASKTICGKGFTGYAEALQFLKDNFS
ncbi:MAG TPA: type II 3-dehydroquinate dehydratase [Clostridia bacterium]|jgi:3-dehydroquinate dehydratase-2|nr:type II 3-dehydroquinate dehydratase [Clostridia bacterium]